MLEHIWQHVLNYTVCLLYLRKFAATLRWTIDVRTTGLQELRGDANSLFGLQNICRSRPANVNQITACTDRVDVYIAFVGKTCY